MFRAPILLVALAAVPALAAAPALRPLTGPAAARLLDGELRCAFESPARTVLLVAAADVDRAARSSAVVRPGATPVRLAGQGRGGFDALVRGGVFRGGGLDVRVTRGARIATGSEQTRHRATLRVARARSSRLYRGIWTCGP